MPISIEFINLIIRKSTLESKYQGGLEQFIKDVPNKSFREDDELVRYGWMYEWKCFRKVYRFNP